MDHKQGVQMQVQWASREGENLLRVEKHQKCIKVEDLIYFGNRDPDTSKQKQAVLRFLSKDIVVNSYFFKIIILCI